MQIVENFLSANGGTTETAEIILAGTENAFRLFTEAIDDAAVHVLCKPVGAAGWYQVLSAPATPNAERNTPLRMEAGDKIKAVLVVTGDDLRASAQVALQSISI